MSSTRGECKRTRPQKHKNRTAFKNDLHDTSKKTKKINALEVTGVCTRCKDIIDWKIKYKKYKPLNAPSKCVSCEQKLVKFAYHILCTKCASDKNVCAKCNKPKDVDELTEDNEDVDIQSMLKGLSERKRRTVLRLINKQDGEQKMTPEIKSHIEDILEGLDKVDLADDFLSDDFGDSDFDD